MKNILIAINNDFLRETYLEVFKAAGFKAIETKSGKEAFAKSQSEKIDLILADIGLAEIGGIELLQKINESGKKISIIILGQYEDKSVRKKALDLEAKDFIASSDVSPSELVRKVKIALGEQKSYRLPVDMNSKEIRSLAADLGYNSDFKCQKCGAFLEMNMIRDLSSGARHFLISFVCPNNCQ